MEAGQPAQSPKRIVGVQLDDGTILSLDEAMQETAREHIKGLFIGVDGHGQRYLKLRQNDEAEENQDSLSLI